MKTSNRGMRRGNKVYSFSLTWATITHAIQRALDSGKWEYWPHWQSLKIWAPLKNGSRIRGYIQNTKTKREGEHKTRQQRYNAIVSVANTYITYSYAREKLVLQGKACGAEPLSMY